MATSSFSSIISHTSTAEFRTWGLELSTAFTSVGFIKTADTGQIDWSSVTIPTTSTSGGYEIRILNDSLHATSPIYVKIEYGTGSPSTNPTLWVTTGTGSNGAGTITDTITSREAMPGAAMGLASNVTSYPSWVCMTEGAVWFMHKSGCRNSGGYDCFFIFRSCDGLGAVTGTSVVIYRGPTFNGGYTYSARTFTKTFSTGYTATSAQASSFGGGVAGYTWMPYGLSGTVTTVSGVPATYQAARHFIVTPQIFPLMNVLSLSSSDNIGLGTVIQATPVGSTQHSYINLTNRVSYYEHLCPIWE